MILDIDTVQEAFRWHSTIEGLSLKEPKDTHNTNRGKGYEKISLHRQ